MSKAYINKQTEVDELLVEKTIQSISLSQPTKQELELALALIDLTSLEGNDTDVTISALSKKAKSNNVAAVCVYPTFVQKAKSLLIDSNIKIASVTGAFPSGQLPLHLRLEEAKYAITEGADEIDMVISRGKLLEGNYQFVFDEVSEFKKVCGEKKLKVILETGELLSLNTIQLASDIAIQAGADFIKTSTGKINVNATLSTVCVMLQTIKKHADASGKKVGIKPSGGISDAKAAVIYLRLTESVLGKEWLQPNLFRFGASRLVDSIAGELIGNRNNNTGLKEGY